jgi:nucleoside-diphosphate-sugar epimerase
MLLAIERAYAKVNIFNLGTHEYCEVNDSIGWITEYLGLTPKLMYTGGERGWIGDSPFIFLDCNKIRSLSWAPKLSIREGIVRTLEYLQANPWVLEAHWKVCVLGLWHLGTVTAACLASAGHEVVGLDFDTSIVQQLQSGQPSLFEPGLEDLVKRGQARGLLHFTTDIAAALAGVEVVWIAYDTPVNDDDQATSISGRSVTLLFPYPQQGRWY